MFPPDIYQKLLALMTPTDYVQENGGWVAKSRTPKVDHVLRYPGFTSDAMAIQDVKGDFDNEAATIHVTCRILGKVGHRQGYWVLSPTEALSKFKLERSSIVGATVNAELRSRENGVLVIYQVTLNLQPGANNIELREKTEELFYDAPPPKLAEGKRP